MRLLQPGAAAANHASTRAAMQEGDGMWVLHECVQYHPHQVSAYHPSLTTRAVLSCLQGRAGCTTKYLGASNTCSATSLRMVTNTAGSPTSSLWRLAKA